MVVILICRFWLCFYSFLQDRDDAFADEVNTSELKEACFTDVQFELAPSETKPMTRWVFYDIKPINIKLFYHLANQHTGCSVTGPITTHFVLSLDSYHQHTGCSVTGPISMKAVLSLGQSAWRLFYHWANQHAAAPSPRKQPGLILSC